MSPKTYPEINSRQKLSYQRDFYQGIPDNKSKHQVLSHQVVQNQYGLKSEYSRYSMTGILLADCFWHIPFYGKKYVRFFFFSDLKKSTQRAVPQKRCSPTKFQLAWKCWEKKKLAWRFEQFEEHLFDHFLIFAINGYTYYFECD